MYKNITLVAFMSAFMLTACGGGGSNTVPTGNASSSKAPLSSASSSSKNSVASSSATLSSAVSTSASSVASSVPSSVSSASAPGEVASSSVVSSSSAAPLSSVASSSVKSSSSSVKSSSSSVKSSSSSVKSSSSSSKSSSSSIASSSSSVSSGPASIYHVRGTFSGTGAYKIWDTGILMSRVGSSDVYEYCANFEAGDAGGGPRFKIDPNGDWDADGQAYPSSDYSVALGWVKISFNSVTHAITTQQNLPAFCPGASSSSSSVASSVIVSSSSSSIASSSKSSSSSSVASSSKSSSSSSAPSSSSSSAASSSLGPHYAGENCVSCHVAGGSAEKKIFTIAGTVYKAANAIAAASPTAPINAEATIVIMDSQRLTEVIRVQTDANGNFYSYQSLGGRALSDLHPKAIGALSTKEMSDSTQPSTGSCNFCHSRTASEDNPDATAPIFIR